MRCRPELYLILLSQHLSCWRLFDVKVKDQKGKVDTTLYAYLDKYQRSSWMGAVVSCHSRLWGGHSFVQDKPEKREGKIDPFHLTVDETKRVAEALSKRILVTIDKKQALPL